MSVIATIALWGCLAGLATGVATLFLASRDLRARVEPELLRFGTGGALFMAVWLAYAGGTAAPHAEIAIGVTVLTALGAGVVLWIARRMQGEAGRDPITRR